jgi:hypothetical protein
VGPLDRCGVGRRAGRRCPPSRHRGRGRRPATGAAPGDLGRRPQVRQRTPPSAPTRCSWAPSTPLGAGAVCPTYRPPWTGSGAACVSPGVSPEGCANAFMQLVGTRGADRRAGRVGAQRLGHPRPGWSAGPADLAVAGSAPGGGEVDPGAPCRCFHRWVSPGRLPNPACLWVPDIRSPQAAWAYSWIRPPSRSRRTTLPTGTRATGPLGPSGGTCAQGTVRAMHVVMVGVPGQHRLQLPASHDE